ncbi:TonB-dependent receptor plug domain-containing protein [Lutimonas sp.]|uniref:TonB-dependent receptor plug domain-containing protein n=1 Tax=Lutimonas sp. TaxID=1872403 RepID=UPI003D9B30E4
MKTIKIVAAFLLVFSTQLQAQETEDGSLAKLETDSLKTVKLDEIILIGREELSNQKQVKPLSSVDEYLERSLKVTMIKRGNYAWEPALNNMNSDRLSLTIDGMQIFGACTDKMDPITSYVDISNLSAARISSGQQGAEHGSVVGGSIDLQMQKSDFEGDQWDIGIDTGFESNGEAKIFSGEFNVSEDTYFVNTDVIYRKAGNYYAGGDTEVLYSQYEKFNISATAGFKTSEKGAIIGSLIYDRANDVGYPALPMDVSLARAAIGSVAYEVKDASDAIERWETKLYVNSIKHVMDDTNRPDVIIHMDMPGWSDTYGFYSKINMSKGKHDLQFNANGYYNKSLAEMTMYPIDQEEALMFMLTWPDVRTTHAGVYGEDEIPLSEQGSVKFTTRLAFQHELVADAFGLNSLQIFYPEMEESQQRVMVNVSAQYKWESSKSTWTFRGGYGERAPSVSEAYGFFLYNSYDNHDYIGNPYLGNEKSAELNANYDFNIQDFSIGAEASYFYMPDYIIGEIDPDLSPMTLGAEGVKVYTALDYATILSSGMRMTYQFLTGFSLSGSMSYNLGQDDSNGSLPMIRPFQYGATLGYQKGMFTAEIDMDGASEQQNYGEAYGESPSDAYTVFNMNIGSSFYFGSQKLIAKAGIENIFDVFYSTYADWNGIPRKGRNVFLNLSYVIK